MIGGGIGGVVRIVETRPRGFWRRLAGWLRWPRR